jgi:transposase-like protein
MKTVNVCSCGSKLEYSGDFSAPGYGQSWKCSKCNKGYRKLRDTFTALSRISPEDMMMDPCDCM